MQRSSSIERHESSKIAFDSQARRGWHRHYVYLNFKYLAWFESNPEDSQSRAKWLKLALSRGKDLGSAHLDSMECTLYVNRLKPNEFAVRFDQNIC